MSEVEPGLHVEICPACGTEFAGDALSTANVAIASLRSQLEEATMFHRDDELAAAEMAGDALESDRDEWRNRAIVAEAASSQLLSVQKECTELMAAKEQAEAAREKAEGALCRAKGILTPFVESMQPLSGMEAIMKIELNKAGAALSSSAPCHHAALVKAAESALRGCCSVEIIPLKNGGWEVYADFGENSNEHIKTDGSVPLLKVLAGIRRATGGTP